MNETWCAWCSPNIPDPPSNGTASHVAVFGNIRTMRVWDIRLCWYHAEVVVKQARLEEMYAPAHAARHLYPPSEDALAHVWAVERL